MMNFNIPSHNQSIAVALSGGGDSMALAHMMCAWAGAHGCTIHLLTVNHNLRPEAKAEADQVAAWVAHFPNAQHHILTWDVPVAPETAIMEKARAARYHLMADYCHANHIQILAIAHHADDQLETFLFRLCKGSGLDGLVGMTEWGMYDNIQLYRPLLHMTHADLITYCQDHDLQWIEDPSNQNATYARPRLRKALETEGLDSKRFAKTLDRMQRGRDALEWLSNKVIDDLCTPLAQKNESDISPVLSGLTIQWHDLQSYPIDIQIRVMQKCLMRIGRTDNGYPPKLERLEDIVATLQPRKSATLYGCMISLDKAGDIVTITVSNRSNDQPRTIAPDQSH